MHLSRRHAIAGLAAVTAAIAAGPLGAQTLPMIRVASPPDDDVTPVLWADKAGIFAKHGVRVEVQSISSGSAVAAAVAGGGVDIGKSSLMALVSAHARGLPFRLIAPSGLYTSAHPVAAFLVAKNSTIRSAKDLNGKVVSAASLRDLNAVASQSWIDEHGGDSKSVRFLEIPNSAVPAALEQGKIDGATVVNPSLAVALASGKTQVIGRSFDAIAHRFLIASWFTTSDYLARNGDTVRRFVAALHESAAYTNTHTSQTVDVLAAYSKMDASVIRGMVRSVDPPLLDPREIQPMIEAAARYKVIERAFPAQEMIAELEPTSR